MLRSHRGYSAVAFVSALVWVGCAHAALGGDAASVTADAEELHGAVHRSVLRSVVIQEISNDSGTTVREFLTPAGRVFALSWQGPVVPDLRSLLGAQYGPYAAALAALDKRGLRGSLRVTAADLVVESEGHLRAFSGRAFLLAEMPAGISVADLR